MTIRIGFSMPPFKCQYQAMVMKMLETSRRSRTGIGHLRENDRAAQPAPARKVQRRALANLVSGQPNQAGFYCYDPTLAQRLRQAADQADQAVNLNLREARFSEGAAGVANAIKNLWNNIGTYTSSLASYVISGGADTDK